MNNQQEEILRDKFYSVYCRNKGLLFYREIPVFSRSVDLVQYNLNEDTITAIEFKIRDWKKAIQQLNDVATCFDYLVLCIPKPKTQKCINNIIDVCIEKGIGLCCWNSIDDTFCYECQPKKISEIWNIQRQKIITYLNEQEGKI